MERERERKRERERIGSAKWCLGEKERGPFEMCV